MLRLETYETMPDLDEGASTFWVNYPAVYGKQLLKTLTEAYTTEPITKESLWTHLTDMQRRIQGNKISRGNVGMHAFNKLLKDTTVQLALLPYSPKKRCKGGAGGTREIPSGAATAAAAPVTYTKR